jgi:hypothetical protein
MEKPRKNTPTAHQNRPINELYTLIRKRTVAAVAGLFRAAPGAASPGAGQRPQVWDGEGGSRT